MMLSHSAWPHRVSPSTIQNVSATVPTTQSEESGIVVERGQIATITGSLTSFSIHEHYTDRTDLTSEIDEVESKRELLTDVSPVDVCFFF